MRQLAPILTLLLSAGMLPAQDSLPPEPGGGLFFDVMPVTRQGRMLVPLRPLFEWVRGRVVYESGRITAYEEGSTRPRVELTIGSTQALLSGVPYELEVPPEIIEGRAFVPLRFVAESFGVWVEAQGRIVTLRVPQYEREAQMAIPPDVGSHQAKIWGLLNLWYGLPKPAPPDLTNLPHWNLFAAERKRELLREIGSDAPTIIEQHWGGREVVGIRVLSDATDESAGAASAQVMVKYGDGAVYQDDFGFVLEPDGWKVRRQSSSQVG